MDWIKDIAGDWARGLEKAKDLPKVQKPLPDGEHRAAIIQGSLDPNKPQIRFSLQFVDHENIVRTKVIFMTGDLSWTARELEVIGAAVEDPNQLEAAVAASVGKILNVYVKTKPGEKYSKIYFNSDTGQTIDLAPKNEDPSAW